MTDRASLLIVEDDDGFPRAVDCRLRPADRQRERPDPDSYVASERSGADADEILAAFERGAGTDAAIPPPLQPMTPDRVEWEHINRVLVDCGGNVSDAARRLGLHRRTLQRKLAKYPAKR